ncbi:HEAT repeat domain-containing protein [Desulfoluna sp.]|uniref:HEAT repeat domain-containing protein n=1 Tax=Desulfoluna sp. TaxID=2045199 RepID=UPI002622370E|nr:HEAT repeat domain-containing protein [Desulfoluna sp.]
MMNGYVKAISKCAAALSLFHIAATLFVRKSNLLLLAKTQTVTEAGFLALPNPATRPPLDSWEAALCGALFFTLTSGALALCTGIFAPSLHRLGLLSRKRAMGLHVVLCLLFFLLIGVTTKTTPLLIGAAGVYLILLPSGERVTRVRLTSLLIHALIPVLLALCIAGTHVLLPQGLFSGFRDAFLFDNPAGNAVRNFYYTYTLYPAEAFKSPNQKSQLTVHVPGAPDPAITSALRKMGHLPVSTGPWDYTLTRNEGTLSLCTAKVEHTVNTQQFLTDPTPVFREFAQKADAFAPLRTLTWYALFTGFPLLFYLLFHTVITLMAGLFCPLALAARISTVGVAAFAAFCMLLLAVGLSLPEGTQTALDDLSTLSKESTDATGVITRAIDHESALVRYRAALAIPSIRAPRLKHALLLQMSKDRDINVVCQALGAMGKTREPRYLRELEEAVRTRPEWYVQWYGYRAMRRLGWRPNPR